MPNCRLIICEKTSHWAPVLRGLKGGCRPQIVETRSLAGCEAALSESPASLVALEVAAANLEPVLDFLSRVGCRFPRCATVALLTPETMSAARLVQEAGAIQTVFSVLEAPQIVGLAHRQLARAPREQVGFRQFVLEQMPWASHATAQPCAS